MNWDIKKMNKVVSSEMDMCEHLKEGDTAHIVEFEMDSFGPVGAFASCKECAQAQAEKAAEELVYCNDCGKEHPSRNVIAWRWYDFYAAQGDVPYMVCIDCQKAEKHIRRVNKDAKDRQDELDGNYGLDDDDDDYHYY